MDVAPFVDQGLESGIGTKKTIDFAFNNALNLLVTQNATSNREAKDI